MYIHIYIYIHTHTYVYIYIYIYIYTYTCVRVYMYTRMYDRSLHTNDDMTHQRSDEGVDRGMNLSTNICKCI